MCTSKRDDHKLEYCQAKPIQTESFTRSELKLEWVHQESHRLRHLQEKGYQATSETETSSEASYLG